MENSTTDKLTKYDLSQLEVLVLENNIFMGKMLSQILRSFNLKKIHLSSKMDAAFGYFQNNTIDLVFSNWAPATEEIEFLRMVRDPRSSKNPYVPIIVVSSYNEKKYVELARDLGMTEFLTLPVTPQSIYQHVCSVIEHPRTFIETATYMGPDRRRNDTPIQFDDRRKHPAELDSNAD
ncbi:MAG: response regulator [Rhodospirillaceae bacterium]|jgi:two-component system, chemotaxis family, chemotaxis protein CheY|nr:response regulator [Rhodospirillaceae bacterium]